MVRFIILAIVFYLAFRFFLWLVRTVLLPFITPRQPPSTTQGEQPDNTIDPKSIQDAKFVDLPPSESNSKEN
jgi:hypothetical protein